MNKKCLLIALLIFVLYPCVGFPLGVDVVGPITKISISTDTIGSVNVSIVTVKTSQEYPYDKTSMWGGDEENSALPKRIISLVTVVKNKQKVFIPLSAYVDLGDPNHIELQAVSAHKFQLIIVGSDAAGSYKATLEFKENEILHRKVVSGEFPDEVWEETKYKFNHLDN